MTEFNNIQMSSVSGSKLCKDCISILAPKCKANIHDSQWPGPSIESLQGKVIPEPPHLLKMSSPIMRLEHLSKHQPRVETLPAHPSTYCDEWKEIRRWP